MLGSLKYLIALHAAVVAAAADYQQVALAKVAESVRCHASTPGNKDFEILGIGGFDLIGKFPRLQSTLQRPLDGQMPPGVLHCVCDGLAGVGTVFIGYGGRASVMVLLLPGTGSSTVGSGLCTTSRGT